MTGIVKYKPGPSTGFSLPNRSTTTFSQLSAMCVDDSTSSAASSMATIASIPTPPVAANAMPSTAAQVAMNVAMLKMTAPFYAEKTLTADLVPVTVDAVLFWVVWDAEKACTEVEDYYAAVSFLAQTALREAVGRSTVAEVALRRDQLDAEIKDDIEKEAAGWGVDIISVKVRDIVIPDELQEVMSLEAQADREKNARMTVAGVEAELAEMLAEAARVYGDPEAALKLRTMLMQYDTVKKSKGTVVTVPTAMSDGFTDSAMMNGDRTTER